MYSFSADLWSLGITTFFLLSQGEVPFGTEEDYEEGALGVFEEIIQFRGPVPFEGLIWSTVRTQQAKDFVCSLLEPDGRRRPQAKQADQNPWLVAHAGGQGGG